MRDQLVRDRDRSLGLAARAEGRRDWRKFDIDDVAATEYRVHRFHHGAANEDLDPVVAEAPMEIRLAGVPLAVLMRTPGYDSDLVRGFALTEGIVLDPDEIASVLAIGTGDDARYELVLADGVHVDPERFRRTLYATSSCGVCGKASIDAVRVSAAAPTRGPRVTVDVLTALPGTMREHQVTFSRTGGIHAAALFTPDGTMRAIREDIGRHNALDKLVGALSNEDWPLGDSVLLVSGRVSFEIVQKAAVAGIPFVAGVSAPSTLAVDLGRELGMSVIGFLRGSSFNVYAGAARID